MSEQGANTLLLLHTPGRICRKELWQLVEDVVIAKGFGISLGLQVTGQRLTPFVLSALGLPPFDQVGGSGRSVRRG